MAALEQVSYTLRIVNDEGTQLFEEEKQTDVRKTLIDLSHFEQKRKTFSVHLILRTDDKTERKLLSKFTTKGDGIQKADWITRLDHPIAKEATYFRDNPSIILSKKIQLDTPIKNAWIDLCGLGYYTLSINGGRVGKDCLNNDVTNYDKLVYYDTYDISKYLVIGENTITVELGNGWYNPAPINILGKYNVRRQLSIGKPCLIAALDFEDSIGNCWQVLTDKTWESAAGTILMNNVFVGEKVSDESWEKTPYTTVKIQGPAGKLVPGTIPKIQRNAVCLPKKIIQQGEKVVIDFGEIITGQTDFTVSKEFTGRIIANYSERISEDDSLDFSSTISGIYGITDPELGIVSNQRIIQSDTLEKTKKQTFHFSNQYTYHSFRYVELIFSESINFSEVIKDFSAFRVYTNVEVITEFQSSLPVLNDLWQAGLQTRLNNIHSYFEDCTRERFGYGGDIVALIDSHMYSIAGCSLLKKVMLDFINDQTIEGGITATAPFVGIMTNGPSNKAGAIDWQLVLPTIANKLLQFYDEKSFVRRFTEEMKKHINYLLSFDFDFIKVCSLGDWGSIDEKSSGGVITSPDQEFCSACSYSIILQEYQLVMKQLSQDELAYRLFTKITEINRVIIATYYHAEGYFGDGSQSSYVFALKADILSGDQQKCLIEQLVQKIRSNAGIISTGIFGMSWIYEQLDKHGYEDALFQWLTRDPSPSYQSMIAETGTLSEHFPVKEKGTTYNGSLNHAMFSSYSAWMVKSFLGISFPDGYFNQVKITPQTKFSIKKIKGSIKTPYGMIQLQWTQRGSEVLGEIILPKNLPYELVLMEEEWQIEEHSQDMEHQQEKVIKLFKG